jgi:segregation and condensation protein A
MNTAFTVETAVFEGPFSALLDLIEKHKLSINEVSLSEITEEYISYIKGFQDVSMEDLSSFIVVAATLMLIKSRTLLPGLSVTEEEKSDIDVLEKRLATFQVVRAVADYVRKEYGKKILFQRPFVRIRTNTFSPDKSITPSTMLENIALALQNIPKELETPKTYIKKTINIENIVAGLYSRVQKEMKFRLSEFAKTGSAGLQSAREVKTFLVVSFLAVLELVKNGTLDAQQDDTFGEITIQS